MAAGLMIAAAGAWRQMGSLSCAKMLIAPKESIRCALFNLTAASKRLRGFLAQGTQ